MTTAEIIKDVNGLSKRELDGYYVIESCFADWIDEDGFIDVFYIVTFDMKYDFEKNYTHKIEIFSLDGYEIEWYMDWCEGQTDIKNIHFYSLDDINYILRGISNED